MIFFLLLAVLPSLFPCTASKFTAAALPLTCSWSSFLLAELRRHKRSFLKLATKVTFARLSDAAAARRMFVDYLRGNLTGAGGAGAGGLAGPEAWASGVGGDG